MLRHIAAVCGVFGMVSPRDKTCLLHPVVGRFHTGDTIRDVQPAEVIGQVPWVLEDNKSCGLRLTFDVPHGKTLGTLTAGVQQFFGTKWVTLTHTFCTDLLSSCFICTCLPNVIYFVVVR